MDLPDVDTMKKLAKAAEGVGLDIPIHLAIMELYRSVIYALELEDFKEDVICIHSSVVNDSNKRIAKKEFRILKIKENHEGRSRNEDESKFAHECFQKICQDEWTARYGGV